MNIKKIERQALKKNGFLTSLKVSHHISFEKTDNLSTNGLIDTGASVTSFLIFKS